jgi:hypothetical protein
MDKVEVFEVSSDEWDAICLKHLSRLGLTAQELKEKNENKTLNHKEFKVWMLVSSSGLI